MMVVKKDCQNSQEFFADKSHKQLAFDLADAIDGGDDEAN